MFVTKCWFDLHLMDEPDSLKGKRHVIKSLKEQIWNRFRISIAEVGKKDLWQRSELGIAFVSADNGQAEQLYSKLMNFLDSRHDIEIVDIYREVEKVK